MMHSVSFPSLPHISQSKTMQQSLRNSYTSIWNSTLTCPIILHLFQIYLPHELHIYFMFMCFHIFITLKFFTTHITIIGTLHVIINVSHYTPSVPNLFTTCIAYKFYFHVFAYFHYTYNLCHTYRSLYFEYYV